MLPRCPAGSQNEPKKVFPDWYSRCTVFLEKWTPERSTSRKEKKHENNERHAAWELKWSIISCMGVRIPKKLSTK
jgi:hypothetical protein